ncbi:hypothetical protein CDD83_8993 [Cordyceps sp. RAO-2017]|nr:hypothetical protein CDD83_8993 [Cordyceps sp. RAO-2017]
MKPALVVVAATASLAAAQDQLDGMPACARDCVAKYTTGSTVGKCKMGDIACICGNKDFLNSIACCLTGVCSQQDLDKTLKIAKQLCNASGVQVPDKVECNKQAAASSSGSATTSPTGTANRASASSTAAAVPLLASSGGTMVGAALALLAAL